MVKTVVIVPEEKLWARKLSADNLSIIGVLKYVEFLNCSIKIRRLLEEVTLSSALGWKLLNQCIILFFGFESNRTRRSLEKLSVWVT